MWIDNHCHLPAADLSLAATLVDEARQGGVDALINVGCDVDGSRAAIEVAQALDGVWATAGVHPHDAKSGLDGLSDAANAEKVVAIGECGLDYHYNHSDPAGQRPVFAEQIGLAHELGLPLVIHSRSAWDDTFEILRSESVPPKTVFHCFTGGPREAELCLEAGAMLSFSGIVTFPSAPELREAALMCPLDRMMVETDAPYLAPVPHRGKPNRPALVAVVGESIAALLDHDVADFARTTSENARRFYGLDAVGFGADQQVGV